MFRSDTINKLAELLFLDENPSAEWADAAPHAATWLAEARTIASAAELGQTELEAAQRIAVWNDVDRKKRWKPWCEQDYAVREACLRHAKIGYAGLALLTGLLGRAKPAEEPGVGAI